MTAAADSPNRPSEWTGSIRALSMFFGSHRGASPRSSKFWAVGSDQRDGAKSARPTSAGGANPKSGATARRFCDRPPARHRPANRSVMAPGAHTLNKRPEAIERVRLGLTDLGLLGVRPDISVQIDCRERRGKAEPHPDIVCHDLPPLTVLGPHRAGHAAIGHALLTHRHHLGHGQRARRSPPGSGCRCGSSCRRGPPARPRSSRGPPGCTTAAASGPDRYQRSTLSVPRTSRSMIGRSASTKRSRRSGARATPA